MYNFYVSAYRTPDVELKATEVVPSLIEWASVWEAINKKELHKGIIAMINRKDHDSTNVGGSGNWPSYGIVSEDIAAIKVRVYKLSHR